MEAPQSHTTQASAPIAAQAGEAKASVSKMLSGLKGMDKIEELISSKLTSDAPLLETIPRYLQELGGKRIRPALTLLVSKAFGGSPLPPEQVIDVAAGIELIHMATLLHDDIIDKSPLRRHKESPFLKFGLSSSLLAGDFLLVRAFSLCARLDRYVIDATEKACIELTEGEILETPLFKEKHTVESSLNVARKKTASLFRLAADTGTHLSLAPDSIDSQDREQLLSEVQQFGESLGLAFQILDDILDVTSTEDLLGKKAGIDIIERKPSIVNVLWGQTGTPLAMRLFEAPGDDEEKYITESLAELNGSAVVAEARELARSHARDASMALEAARCIANDVDEPAIDLLRAIIDYTLERMV
jgi:geranylgeranyl pyrophosphate synthase